MTLPFPTLREHVTTLLQSVRRGRDVTDAALAEPPPRPLAARPAS